MKRFLTFVTALLLIGAAVAADKVVQSSARHMPKWVGGMEEGFIIVAAEAESLDAAQQKAITGVREQIISAIATRVQSSTSITIHEVADNGSIQSHRELLRNLSVEAADIPYLANISPSHAADFYWTKVRRSDKSIYYTYHVKYPLSNSKLRLLVEEYEKQQKAINDTIEAFAAVDFSNYDDLDKMLMQHSRLKQFVATLREEDHRRDVCAAIRRSYEQMLNQNLHVVILSSDRQQTRVQLQYGQFAITNNLVPKATSNCLTAIQTRLDGNSCLISYDFQTGCYEEDQNWLNITYTVLGKKYTTRCFIK